LITSLATKFIKGHWGSILPGVFKSAAEGDFGPQVKATYWFMAKYKTVTGAVLMGLGAAAESVAPSHPEWPWLITVAQTVYYIGEVGVVVGLVDGGTRSPWPTGTPKD
jgi:hypothetical protein